MLSKSLSAWCFGKLLNNNGSKNKDAASSWTADMKRLLICLFCFCLVLPGFPSGAFGADRSKAEPVIKPVNYQGVTLGQCRLGAQYELVRREYLSIPNDDLLLGFRKRAGLEALGKELGGWYSNDGFNAFGQVLSGLSRFFAGSGDRACLEKVNYLVAQWAKCIDAKGYFYYSDHPNAPHYVYDKMVGGLLDAFVYCGNKQALECLSRITDWAMANLTRNRVYACNAGYPDLQATEWYTLSENLFRAWLVTGEQKYKDFAQVWEYSKYWDYFASGRDIFEHEGRYHAYSHVNAVNGAGPAYLATGEDHYLRTLVNAHDFFINRQCYVTGGYGPWEEFKRTKKDLAASLYFGPHFETQCGSWAAFKLSKYLVCLTGDARFGDWVERLLYNGIGASLPLSTDGCVQYWSDYSIQGASKQNADAKNAWSCCTGTRPMAVADYVDQIWFTGDKSIFVSQYVPSSLSCSIGDRAVTVRQSGVLEESQAMEFVVNVPGDTQFALCFRAPGWLKSPMSAELNGKPVTLAEDEKHWAVIERTWADGDRVRLSLPMQLEPQSLSEGFYPVAFSYGPVALACPSSDADAPRKTDLKQAETDLVLTSASPLEFTSQSDAGFVRARNTGCISMRRMVESNSQKLAASAFQKPDFRPLLPVAFLPS